MSQNNIAICIYLGMNKYQPIPNYTLNEVTNLIKSFYLHHNNIPQIILITNINDIISTDNSIVLKINESAYHPIDGNIKELEKYNLSKEISKIYTKHRACLYYKLELFRLYNYDRIIYIDTDILIHKNISELWDLTKFNDCDIYGYKQRIEDRAQDWAIGTLNSGFMIINKLLLCENVYNEMISIANSGLSPDAADQGVIDYYLKNHPEIKVGELPIEYNTFVWNIDKLIPAHETKCIHFATKIKPWQITDEEFKAKYIYDKVLLGL
jgi:lipopolysaccharide biosynthesis glycosyltransferase